jgi:SAM-dependent methyltransferase
MKKNKRYYKRPLAGLFAAITLIFMSIAVAHLQQTDVPFVPTPEVVVMEMLKMANVGKNDVLYDLGCGDGRIVITAARKFGCRGVGIDIDPQRIKESRENAEKAGVSNKVKFKEENLFTADISEATVVSLYLLSEVNLRLRPRLFQELAPGTRVVSHEFSMGRWEPEVSTSVKTGEKPVSNYWDKDVEDYWNTHNVHFWIIPANVTGTWELTIPDISLPKMLTMKFEQEFQQVKGKAFEGASEIPLSIEDGKIKGNMVHFTLQRKLRGRTQNMHFEGTVKDHIMNGTVEIEGNPGKEKIKWKGKRDASTLRPIHVSDY